MQFAQGWEAVGEALVKRLSGVAGIKVGGKACNVTVRVAGGATSRAE